MLKKLLLIISVPLVIVHLIILYFWIVAWEKLITEIGLLSWIGSILLGIIVYFVYWKLNYLEKEVLVTKRIVFSSTLMTVFLSFITILIEFVTSSMP